HRTGPERNRARLCRNRGGWACDDPRRTLGALAGRCGARRRPRPAAGIHPGELRPAGVADRADAGVDGAGRLAGDARRGRGRNRCGAARADRPPREDRAIGPEREDRAIGPEREDRAIGPEREDRAIGPEREDRAVKLTRKVRAEQLSVTSDRATCPRPRIAPLQRAALVLAHAAPYTGVLAGIQRPRQALGSHRTAVAHQLRLRDLGERRSAVTHREEQLRIFVTTDRLVAPIHVNTPCWVRALAHRCVFGYWFVHSKCFGTVAIDRFTGST